MEHKESKSNLEKWQEGIIERLDDHRRRERCFSNHRILHWWGTLSAHCPGTKATLAWDSQSVEHPKVPTLTHGRESALPTLQSPLLSNHNKCSCCYGDCGYSAPWYELLPQTVHLLSALLFFYWTCSVLFFLKTKLDLSMVPTWKWARIQTEQSQ